MRISIVSPNLTSNGMARTLLLAEALATRYDVSVVGTIFGDGVWEPMRGSRMPMASVAGAWFPRYLSGVRRLLQLIDGDLVLACKVRLPSLGVALFKRWRQGTPVILDVDDDEVSLTSHLRDVPLIDDLRNPMGHAFTRWARPLSRRVDAVFCASRYFRDQYGGVVVPHGRAAEEFDPDRCDRAGVRRETGIAESDVVIGFIGTPRGHKGLDLILEAMVRLRHPHLKLMVVGASLAARYVESLCARYPGMIVPVPAQPRGRVPDYLAASDLIVLPQKNQPESYGQMPAKLVEAMAMAKPVIASSLSDIPHYLSGCGWVVPPDDVAALAERIDWVLANPAEARAVGARARTRFLETLTYDAMLDVMTPVIERLGATRGARRRS